MKIVIGADKGGFNLKEAIKAELIAEGYEVQDIGTNTLEEPLPFAEVAGKAARMVQSKEADRGILLCGTGMGMNIAANKFKGIRAAVVESVYAVEYARKINDANILCMGGFIVGASMALEIVKIFLKTKYMEDFPEWRVNYLTSQAKILNQIEEDNFR